MQSNMQQAGENPFSAFAQARQPHALTEGSDQIRHALFCSREAMRTGKFFIWRERFLMRSRAQRRVLR
jgi:hypothetical protein